MWLIRGYSHIAYGPRYLIMLSDDGLRWTKDIDKATKFYQRNDALSVIEELPRSKWITRVSVMEDK